MGQKLNYNFDELIWREEVQQKKENSKASLDYFYVFVS